MSKNRIIWIVSSLLALVLIVFFILDPFNIRKKYLSPLYALPKSTIVFYHGDKFIDAYHSLNSKLFWQDLLSNETMLEFDNEVNSLDSLLKKSSDIYKFINNSQVVISLHRTSNNRFDVLALIQTKGKISPKDIDKLINKQKGVKIIEQNFSGITIYDYRINTNTSQLAYSFSEGILAISKNPVLVEDALRTINENTGIVKKTILGKDFKEFKENWFINHSEIQSLFGFFTREDTKKPLEHMATMGPIGNYQMELNDDGIELRGSIKHYDSAHYFVNLFEKQSARKMDVTRVASSRTTLLIAYNLSNMLLYYQNYVDRKRTNGKWSSWEAERTVFEKNKKISIEKNLVPLIRGQIALAVTEPVMEKTSSSAAIYIRVSNTEEGTRLFRDLTQNPFDTSDSPLSQNYSNNIIYKSSKAEAFGYLFGDLFKFPGLVYFTIIRDFLVFSPNLHTLKTLIDDYAADNILGTSNEFMSLSEKMVSEANYLFYVNPSRSPSLPEKYLNEEWLKKYRNNNLLAKADGFAFQLVNNNNGYYNEILINYSKNEVQKFEKIWETELDTSFSSPPFVMKNHNTSSNEILVFDNKNNLYLITEGGEILWKKQIGSPLVGKIYQVDFFNNKKLQYLFTTETHLQLIDRLGRNVANYPIRLGGKAVSGIGIWGEKMDNTTRFFVGTDNHYVIGYNLSGKPLNGWSPKKISGNLAFPIENITLAGKTYVFGVNTNGIFYLWDGKGQEVLKPKEFKARISNPLKIRAGIDKVDSWINAMDTNGNIYLIYLNGKVQMQKLGDFGSTAYFEFIDVNADKEPDLVFIDRNTLVCYSKEGQIISSAALSAEPSFCPEFILFDEKMYITFLDLESEKLYLSDLSGINVRNFPIECNTGYLFYDMNNDDKQEVIGGFGNKIFMARF